jgi:hypothetical protein
VAVAVLVIGFIPGSLATPTLLSALLSGFDGVKGFGSGVVVDPGGSTTFKIADPVAGPADDLSGGHAAGSGLDR